MPIFEYRCQHCNQVFELLVRGSSEAGDAGPRCPACDSDDLKRLFSLFASRSDRPAPAMAMPGGGGCCGGGCGCH